MQRKKKQTMKPEEQLKTLREMQVLLRDSLKLSKQCHDQAGVEMQKCIAHTLQRKKLDALLNFSAALYQNSLAISALTQAMTYVVDFQLGSQIAYLEQSKLQEEAQASVKH